MNKFKIADKGTMQIFDIDTNEIILEKEDNTSPEKFKEFLNEYLGFKNSHIYDDNKNEIRNYLINKYFLSEEESKRVFKFD